ncbi:MADS-box protein JOINTLESS-like isoform X2 [Diospyros lotus]|nr:MADS-box protein JOINTLESS-like isoform X2 [Diospyros lotus]
MVRQRIQIKKIDNVSARQVTFSKRRRGLFKKAQELSTLCDAEVALLVFSSTDKLFKFSSSSMEQVIERHSRENLGKLNDQPSLELQLESGPFATLSKQLEDKSRKLSQLRGEELNGLNFEELKQLEKLVQGGLHRVLRAKGDKIEKEMIALKRKEARLMEENLCLKRQIEVLTTGQTHEQSSESPANTPGSSAAPSEDCQSSDTNSLLELSLAFRKWI